MSEKAPDNEKVPEAVEHHSRWPGWIWSVPIAALAVVGYLVFQQFTQRGPSVTVTFPTADLKADDTKVKFHGMNVGQVESVTLEKSDLTHVQVVLRLHADLAGHLGPGTKFWIAGQKPSFSNLAALKSDISGPYIGIEPHPGNKQDHYTGLSERPVTADEPGGTHYVLQASSLGNVGHGAVIYYRDLEVGKVEGAHLEKDQRHFRVDISITTPFDKLVRQDTRFWNAGAVQVSMANGGPRLQLQSVPALLEGAVAFETPDIPGNAPAAKPDTVFKLYDTKDAAVHAPNSRAVRYQVVFHAAEAGALTAGAPVTLDDKRVGTVTESRLQYDPSDGSLHTVATLAIEPGEIDLAGNASWADDPKPQMDALMRRLIGQGLRARLGSKIPLVGGKSVQLAFVPSATAASLGSGPVPEIPAGPSSGVSGIMASLSSVAGKLNAMPLDQIADEVHTMTQHFASIAASPELTQSLANLDRSLANIEQISRKTNAQVDPLLTELRRAATEAQETMRAAQGIVGNSALASTEPGNGSLGGTLYELNRAARSLRELADYLDRHPAALLHGRGGF
ncbi:PqiB family protein [Rhodopila globiformis]|uniref:Mce/MlaD domain-containing protein n=1 Tax=Rhodopila globiformis TaxID=1071 RepID=A0A2S6N6C7_RHOGL|nr:MlaD family protein [Rhodopila globiformis]PPQ30152.1 hypothetical protein CCS01_19835 [Rhodopila globiformis]